MMIALLLYCWSRERAVLAGDRAGLCGGRRLPGDRRAAAARSRHDRALCRAPRGGAGRAVRRGAGAVRRRRPGDGRGDRDRRHQGARQRQPRPRRSTTSRSRRRSSRRRSPPTPPRPPCWASGAVTSCPRSWPPRMAARAGCAPRASGWTSSAPSGPEPIPRSRPARLLEAKRRLEEDLAVERAANEQLRGLPSARRDERRPPVERAAQALHAARDARRARSTSPTRTPSSCTACAAGSRATTPRPSATSST